jgi:hypothetical protein
MDFSIKGKTFPLPGSCIYKIMMFTDLQYFLKGTAFYQCGIWIADFL